MDRKTSKENLELLIQKDHQLAFLCELIVFAKSTVKPKTIVLFGSRAVGKARMTSDVDLYFDLTDGDSREWARFCSDAEESLPTLLDIDFVDAGTASQEIRNSVEREGIVIYER